MRKRLGWRVKRWIGNVTGARRRELERILNAKSELAMLAHEVEMKHRALTTADPEERAYCAREYAELRDKRIAAWRSL